MTMKNLVIKLALVAATATAMVFTSCGDPCKDVTCANSGVCNDGDCTCTTGYEGKLCDTLSNAKFLGTYSVVEDCSNSAADSYASTISAGTAANQIKISNFYNSYAAPIIATVSKNTLTIARQEPDGDKYFVVGSGTVSGKVITLKYVVTNETATPIISDSCNSTIFTRP